jgi:hypothetical protein
METDMNYLMIFKRRILRKIFGLVHERDGWRIRTNHELNKLIGGANVVRFIEAQRLKWWGHLHRMEEYRMVRRNFEWSQMGRRSRGHPRNRWRDEVLKDVRVLGVKNWTKAVMVRSVWHDVVEKSKTHRVLKDERRRCIFPVILTHC